MWTVRGDRPGLHQCVRKMETAEHATSVDFLSGLSHPVCCTAPQLYCPPAVQLPPLTDPPSSPPDSDSLLYSFQGERGGLVQTLSPTPTGEAIFSLSWLPPSLGSGGGGGGGGGGTPSPLSSHGLLASAGGDRALVFTEPRKWHTVHKWQAPVKYAIHHVAFSQVDRR